MAGARLSPGHILERAQQYLLLMRFHRPIGIMLLLWPTLWALLIAAQGMPDTLVLIVFILGVVLMRAAGCVINDYADRRIDAHVRRTRDRPLAAGKVSPREALILFATLCLFAFGLVLLMNSLTVWLSLAGALLAAIYPYTKRYTYLPQVFLGMAFGWAVPMAFAAQTGELSRLAWLVYVATILWATVYDTMYAMVDREDDIRIGVKSTAILFGNADRMAIGMLQVLFMLVMLLAGKQAQLGLYYYLGLSAASLLAVYQHYLIRRRDPKQCFQAFLNNNWFGMAIFLGIAADYAAASA